MEFARSRGRVCDAIETNIASWLSCLEHAVEPAQEQGEIDASVSAHEITFRLNAFAQAANAQFQLFRDRRMFDNARRAIRERLGSLRPARAA